MILAAANDHNIDLTRSWLIGDRWVDVAAANAANVKSILIDRVYSMAPTSHGDPPSGLRIDAKFQNLGCAADYIVSRCEVSE